MYATILKNLLASTMKSEGEKLIRKDKNDVGKDDAAGKSLKAIGAAVEVIELDTVNKETFRNMANGFRAAADELDKAAAEL